MKTRGSHFRPKATVRVAILALLAIKWAAAPQAYALTMYTGIVGDLANPRAAIDFGNPSYGYAQEFTITSGTWDIFQAQINLGDLATMPGSPLLQVRNAQGSGLGPGMTVLGSFTMNPNDIPTGFNFANIVAPVDASFILGPGTYWFCLGNDQPTGGFWVPFASDNSLVEGGVAGTVDTTAVAQSGDGGQTFGAPSLGGYSLLFELDAQPVPEPGTAKMIGVVLMFLGWRFLIRCSRRTLNLLFDHQTA
ncbi:MAG: hypothetical protein ABSA45_05945 [Verrucomicrobiota bacterium]|jgi:hypothetical protein